MKKWIKTALKISPEALTIRAFQKLEDHAGLRAFFERPHDYWTPFEQPRHKVFGKRAYHLRREGTFETEAIQSYFRKMPDFEKELVLANAELVRMGAVQWFGKEVMSEELLDWHRDPFENISWPRIHYTRVRANPVGDFRTIWEIGRLNWLSPILTASCLEDDPRWRLHYFSILRSFVRDNPVGEGVHWTNGQEVALRAIQILIALVVFGESLEETEFELAADMLYWHGRYIRTHFEVADIALKNNHALIEAGCLALLGSYFPSWEESNDWIDVGTLGLEKHSNQFYNDGGYLQHSHNYHRFVLTGLLYFERLGLSLEKFNIIFERSAFYFQSLIQMPDGRLPNFGQNDSAMFGIAGLTDLRDYRPFMNALTFRAQGTQMFFDQRSKFLGALLYGDAFLASEKKVLPRASVHFNTSGIAVIRNKYTAAFLRTSVGTMKSGHNDLGHCDVWIGGKNLAIDSGSYLYCSPEIERDVVMESDYHNVIVTDETRGRTPLGRFSWLEDDVTNRVLMDTHRAIMNFQSYVAPNWRSARKVRCDPNEVWVIDELDPLTDVDVSEFTIRWIWAVEDGADQAVDASQISTIEDGFSVAINGDYKLDVFCYGAQMHCELHPTFHAPNYRDQLPAVRFEIKVSSLSGFRIHSVFRPCESS